MPVATSSMRRHRWERTVPDQCYREITLPFVWAIPLPGSRGIGDLAHCNWPRLRRSCHRPLSHKHYSCQRIRLCAVPGYRHAPDWCCQAAQRRRDRRWNVPAGCSAVCRVSRRPRGNTVGGQRRQAVLHAPQSRLLPARQGAPVHFGVPQLHDEPGNRGFRPHIDSAFMTGSWTRTLMRQTAAFSVKVAAKKRNVVGRRCVCRPLGDAT